MLRPAKRPSGKEAERFLRRLLPYIRANWPRTEILLRADSHYCVPETIDFCRAHRRLIRDHRRLRGIELSKIAHHIRARSRAGDPPGAAPVPKAPSLGGSTPTPTRPDRAGC